MKKLLIIGHYVRLIEELQNRQIIVEITSWNFNIYRMRERATRGQVADRADPFPVACRGGKIRS
jgi:hypothetical protein